MILIISFTATVQVHLLMIQLGKELQAMASLVGDMGREDQQGAWHQKYEEGVRIVTEFCFNTPGSEEAT